ncbi:hypothetical protein RvY_15623-1 [Ramazzottius varieornatus]|uniref:Enoyl-[acyl-carrier-protein] reductase, mitochondrial n=1 Tax=Ramazzottius varieornatus TaxID=947166 RepID=A0A1D1W3G6_RAMVA|nr:hypothetical protein RvY_15623-1 [Ramazzottius varieornatus]
MFLPSRTHHLGRRMIVSNASSWTAAAVRYSENGDPEKVLELTEESVSGDLGEGNVALKLLAAPVNPADINTIQGVYGIKPPLPATPGGEGLAEVLDVGTHVRNVQKGDRVIFSAPMLGTWRTYTTASATQVLKISKEIPLIAGATITINPPTAFRMLYDFVGLRKNDVIVQNAANSAVGQAVIQIAAANNWRTVNIIRDRPNKADTVQFLSSLGATHVITDADFKRKEVLQSLPKAQLGLNAVSGKAVADMVKLMNDRSTLVTYGGMSKQPLLIPTTALIFKDIICCGFWVSRWNDENSTEERIEMLDSLTSLIKDGKLKPPQVEPVLLKDFKQAIQRSQEGFSNRKQLLVMDEQIMTTVQQEIEANR